MDNNYNNYNNNNNNSYNYNPYTNPEYGFQRSEQNMGYNPPPYNGDNSPKKKSPFEGFGVTLVKTVAIALVFGLVAGVAGSTVLHFSGITLGLFSEEEYVEEKEEEEVEEEYTQTIPGGIQQTNTEAQTVAAIMDVSDIVENVMPCVVAISNKAEITYQSFWGQTYTEESESAGTGFIVKQDETYLYIATNNHVVDGASELTVQFSDSTTAVAEIKGTVASKDLAVIKVKVEDISADTLNVIRVATLGDSNELEVGESAIAIGNALGYGQSVTTGVISALGRSVTVADSSGTTIVNNNLIQTDAAINPGNSGGALLNIKGEVIGINSVKYADTDVEGIGYAIPISDAMLIVNKLIDGEKIDETQSGYLGIQGQDSSLGAYVYYVYPGSAAEKAGIQKGDIIVEFEETTIATMSQLKELLSYHPAGDKVDFVILRPVNDEYQEIEVVVELGDASILPQQ